MTCFEEVPSAMKWPKARLIFEREVRDQLRDRRTLFMILVLPIILYPALGLGLLQMTLQFGQQPRTVGFVGVDDLPIEPPLLADDKESFHESLFEHRDPGTIRVVANDALGRPDVASGNVDVVVIVPPRARELLDGGEQVSFQIFFDGSNDQSEITRAIAQDLLENWSAKIVARRMREAGKSENFAQPITVEDGVDISSAKRRSGTASSRMLPFLLVMMALSGAFYPAIDLCAGEKERGTMETLLISPATRGEIVLGKFLTIFLFSIATTIVNLASMGLTFSQISGASALSSSPQALAVFAPPSWGSILWMFVLMLPLAGFFSALCMALAVFARSTKEGQYYLMPMFLVVTPLVFLTLAPGVVLNPFYSLVPVTNVALLLKALMLNQTETAAVFFVPVMAPTLLYGFLALRYAAEQFNREEVLFREAERFNVREWLVGLVRHKRPVITFRMAWSFFVLYMVVRWYVEGRFGVSLWAAALGQIFTLFVPAVVFALVLTRRPWESLNLRAPAIVPTVLTLLLAFSVHPVAVAFANALRQLFPQRATEELVKNLEPLFTGELWQPLLLAAVVAPICEEIVFRGVLLTGFLQRYRPPLAILVSSILFGVSHMIPQQMITTTLLGIVLGIIATRTGSILPAMAFHSLHNGLIVYLGHTALHNGVESTGELTYPTTIVLIGALASAILIGVLLQFPSRLRRVPETPLFG